MQYPSMTVQWTANTLKCMEECFSNPPKCQKLHKMRKGNQEFCMEIRTLKSLKVWVSYQINTLQHPMMSFCLILEWLNKISLNFDLLVVSYYNKRQGRKLRPIWRQKVHRKRVKFAHKNSIYSQYFALNLQCKDCSFSGCKLIKHTFSFHCVCWTRC